MKVSNGWTWTEIPTPQTLVEALMFCVRERGLAALKEPDNRRRLRDCDRAARDQIDERIAALIAAGNIAGAKDAAA